MNRNNQVYGCELGRLAYELIEATPALLRRLECMYDEILIDEVQDLSGYDWEIIHALLNSQIDVRMVGDVRQAVLSTNPRGQKTNDTVMGRRLSGSRIAKRTVCSTSTTPPRPIAAAQKSQRFLTPSLM